MARKDRQAELLLGGPDTATQGDTRTEAADIYDRLIQEMGGAGLRVMNEVVDVALRTQSLPRFDGSDRFGLALEAAIDARLADLSLVWNGLSETEILYKAKECAGRVASHRKMLSTMSESAIRTSMLQRRRREAIRDGSISAKFPPGFIPPPRRPGY